MKQSAFLFRVVSTLICFASVLSAQTYTDNFTNPAMWGAPLAASDATSLSVANGRMNYVTTSVGEVYSVVPWNGPILPLDRCWSAKIDMHISTFALITAEQLMSLYIGVGKTGDPLSSEVGYACAREGQGYEILLRESVAGSKIDAFLRAGLSSPDMALRLEYNSTTRAISYQFDENGATGGYSWVPQGTINIASGANSMGLANSDSLTLFLIGRSRLQAAPNGAAYLSNLEVNIDPSVGANPVRLADYYYPMQQGATWLYQGPNGVGSTSNTTHTRVRMANTALNLTLYSPTAYVQSVPSLDVDFGYFSGATFVSTDNWQEYVSIDGGYSYCGMDDAPSEQIRILMAPYPKDWTIGQSVSREISSYSPTGVFGGSGTFMLTLLERSSVTVPAGTFPDSIRLRYTLTNGMTPQVFDEWWALGVGMVKKSRISGYPSNENNGGFMQQLVSCTSPTISIALKSAANTTQTYAINVITAGAWTAVETSDWISLSSTSGTGNGTVNVTLAANPTASPRQGVIVIAGASHVITQAAGVVTAPVIITQPLSQTVSAGSTAIFSVGATGIPAPSFQWNKEGVTIGGATGASLVLTNVQPDAFGAYTVVVTSGGSSVTSEPALLGVSGVAGTSYRWMDYFTPLTVGNIWYFNHSTIAGVDQVKMEITSGAKSITCYTGRSSPVAYQRTVVESSLAYGVYAGGVFTATEPWTEYFGAVDGQFVRVGGMEIPNIETCFDGNFLFPERFAIGESFVVSADGYQNGVFIGSISLGIRLVGIESVTVPAGTFASCLHLTTRIGSAGGTIFQDEWWSPGVGWVKKHRVKANGYVHDTSLVEYRLIAAVAPVITTQPISQTINNGNSVTFIATASGAATLTYQWRKNGIALSGATGSTYTIASVAPGDAGNYTVMVMNSVGSITSNAGVLSVRVAPSNAIISFTIE